MPEETIESKPEGFLHDWDNVILQINKGEEKIGAIRMMKQDMEGVKEYHGMSDGDVLNLLLQTIVSTPKNP